MRRWDKKGDGCGVGPHASARRAGSSDREGAAGGSMVFNSMFECSDG